MSLLELFLVSLSLSLDAMTASVGAGALNRMSVLKALTVALVFGVFQGLMPLLGWYLGSQFSELLTHYGKIIGFVLILLVGLKMLKESFGKEDVEDEKNILSVRTLLVLAIATSIDALVIGITFTFIPVNLLLAVVMIGVVTFLMSLLGIYIGTKSRHLIGTKIELIGALVLIVLAFKTLLF